jgi:DNA helicase II / ATP-dependent DNA helicase PcrA
MTANKQNLSLAEQAAETALAQVFSCIDNKKSFILEAGAGAGKTYSLIKALRRIIDNQGDELIRNGQQVACITYTNVAKDEIRARTDSHPAILAETIHSFCWSLIQDYQPHLRSAVASLPKWPERLAKHANIDKKSVRYDLGYPGINETDILLGHDDVIALTVKLFEKPKFRTIFTKKFPVLFIDEYQDTNADFAEALQKYFIADNSDPLIGFFGDHWQKIYGNGCGAITNSSLVKIGKGANFRSDKAIVALLNRLRPELTQEAKDDASDGKIIAYETNSWRGERQNGNHWKGDLPSQEAHACLDRIRKELEEKEEWDFSPTKTKVLMLTHNVLANEQNYRNLANVFSRTESYIKKEDDYIAFLINVVEGVCTAYENRKYGEMFALLGNKYSIRSQADKLKWTKDLDALLELRRSGTIGQVLDHLKISERPHLPEKIERAENRIYLLSDDQSDLDEKERERLEQIQNLRSVDFQEVIFLSKFIDDLTPFSTKHSVKGAEFNNVLVVIGRGWNQYNFAQMLEWISKGVPFDKEDSFERNRNLFYVACSRPKNNLALLFTQELSEDAKNSLANLLGGQLIMSCY